MNKLGWDIYKDKNMVSIIRKTNEVNIGLTFKQGEKVHIWIVGHGDLDHHLIEDTMRVLNKLTELKGISHKLS